MKFKAFLLDQWLQQHADAEFDLGNSTGPRWTARELLELAGDSDHAAWEMLRVVLHHPPTAGAKTLREATLGDQRSCDGEPDAFARTCDEANLIFEFEVHAF